MYTTINPVNLAPINQYAWWSEKKLLSVLCESADVAYDWRLSDWSRRVEVVKNLGVHLLASRILIAQSIVSEMGKPITQAFAEVDKCIQCCQQMPALVAKWLLAETGETSDGQPFRTEFEPLGLIFAIMPWNFPLWQIIRALVPAILVGNGMVLSPAPCTLGTALLLEKIFKQTTAPINLFRCLIIPECMAEQVIAHSAVQGVTLTGSTQAGQAVASLSGRYLKKTVLELGGSDPYLVLEDADIATAAACCVHARMANAGQICISPKRIIVHQACYDQFVCHVRRLLLDYQCADPALPTTRLGPMARVDLRDVLHQQVADSITQGAACLLGGQVPAVTGAFYPATLLTDVVAGMPACDQELFGPVMVVMMAHSTAHAIELANNSEFGLTAAVFSANHARAQHVAAQLQVGCCGVNRQVRSHFEIPFGGVKRSGFGRELGRYGCYEFVNIKTSIL